MTTDVTSTDTASTATIEPDPERVQQLDPRGLIMDANVRHDAAPDRAMVASVREHGVLQPIIAFATGDGRARVRLGHRRTLASIAAERATVPVIVHPTSTAADEAAAAAAEVDRIAQQSVENAHRQGLNAAEQMNAFADLAGLGLTAGEIASKTKTRRRDVVDGLRAARVPEVRDAVQSAGLTLEQGAALEEFSDDPEHYELLLERATNPRAWGPGFDHTVQQLRDKRDEAADRQTLLTELAEAGTPVIERPDFDSATKRLVDLTDDPEDATAAAAPAPDPAEDEFEDEFEDEDQWDAAPVVGAVTGSERGAGAAAPITPEAHAGCPGHAVFITTGYGGPRRGPRVMAVYVCTDPLGHGHRSRTGVPLRQPSGPAPRRADETPEQAEDREAAEKAEKAAVRRRVIAGLSAADEGPSATS